MGMLDKIVYGGLIVSATALVMGMVKTQGEVTILKKWVKLHPDDVDVLRVICEEHNKVNKIARIDITESKK